MISESLYNCGTRYLKCTIVSASRFKEAMLHFGFGGDPTVPNMGVSKTGGAKNNCDDLT